MKQQLTLKIAGFNVFVDFSAQANPSFRKDIETNILSKFSGFITSRSSLKEKIEYKIIFIPVNIAETIYDTKNQVYYFKIFCFRKAKIIETYQHISFSDFSIILREIAQKLLVENDGFIMHASAVTDDKGRAYLFTGHSGAGKSTIMKLLSPEYTPLGDDSVFIRRENNVYYLYQTPLFEKNWLSKNYKRYPIKGFFFLRKNKKFDLHKIKNNKTTIVKFMEQLMLDSQESKKEPIHLLKFIKKHKNFYTLSFDKNKLKLLKYFNSKINV